MAKEILIVGGGIAALSAAEAARKQDPEAKIKILSQEKVYPYYRLRVGEVLANSAKADKLFLHEPSWYEEKGLELKLDTLVEKIDSINHCLTCQNGEKFTYDKLIIASGSKSRIIRQIDGCERENVYTLWTMEDAKTLSEAIREKNIKHCAIIGGGVLGLESAWQILNRGLKVSLIEFQDQLMMNQLNPAASKLMEEYINSLGIDVYCSANTHIIYGEGECGPVQGLRLADGREISCDAVLFSVGVISNTDIVDDNIKVNRRIVVDSKMQTSAEDIYAAGDVCEVGDSGYWFGLWSIAMQEGKVAGTNAAGGQSEFKMAIPPYMVNSLGTRIVSQGDLGKEPLEAYRFEDEVDESNYSYKRLVYIDDELVGFILIGEAAKDMVKLQKLLK